MHTKINQVSQAIIGAAIEVHRTLGPGLLESAYQQCLSHEFSLRQIPFERQTPLHVDYKGVRLDCAYRLDFLVSGMVVVEVKAIEALLPSAACGRNQVGDDAGRALSAYSGQLSASDQRSASAPRR